MYSTNDCVAADPPWPRLAWSSGWESFLRIVASALHYLHMDIAKYPEMLTGHIDDHDLERYHLGMVKDENKLTALEGHLLWCESCVDRAEEVARYVDAIRSAAC